MIRMAGLRDVRGQPFVDSCLIHEGKVLVEMGEEQVD